MAESGCFESCGEKSDRVAQLVERGFKIQISEVRTPPALGAQDKFVRVFAESKILCWLAIGVPNPCVYTHTRIIMDTL